MDFFQLKPTLEIRLACPYCQGTLQPRRILWQGIHVCAEALCQACDVEFIADLPVGHAKQTPFQVELSCNRLHGSATPARRWLGQPLLDSLRTPRTDEIPLQVERFQTASKIIILNCLDFLYGHALLKLLNADALLQQYPEVGLVVLIPPFLRWLVPDGVAEIWVAKMPLAKAQNYYPNLHHQIEKECERFNAIYLSSAHSHPAEFDITRFTRIPLHDFSARQFRVTFIWREDRPWLNHDFTRRATKRFKPLRWLAWWQNWRVRRLFAQLRPAFPQATFTVAGLGRRSFFPAWIEDLRVDHFDDLSERAACQIYSESRLVIGVHGSSMLLPSAHAGITIDLMTNDRWPNFAQDVLYQPATSNDLRMTAWRHQYLPLESSTRTLALAAKALLERYTEASRYFSHQP